jgi:gliding motility-associated-like protein
VGATAASYTPSVATVGTTYYYCIISQTGANCQVTSNVVSIIKTTPPSISAQPVSTQTICAGSTPSTLSVSYINGTGTPSYQWYSNPTNSTLNGTPISGATGSSYSPPQQTSAGSIYYYCVIQLSAGGCSSLTSTTAAVHVNGVNAGVIGSNQTLCFGTAAAPLVALSPATGSGTLTYVWQKAPTTNYTTILGATAASYSPGVLSASQNYQLIVRSTLNGFACLDTTNNVSITINPLPQLTNAPTQIICNNEQLSIALSASITSSYSWHALPNASINGETTTNQFTGLIADSLSNTSTTAQFVTYIITPTSLNQGCVGPADTIIVQVQPTIGLTLPPTITICSGLPVNALLSANVASSFQWFVTLDNPNVTGESLSPSSVAYINDYLVNTTSVNQLVVYSVVPVSLAGACNGTAQTLAVLVKPPIQLINPDTVFICSGTAVNLLLVANTAVTFNWYADQQPNVLNETTNLTASSSIQDVLINTTNATQEVIYHAIGTTTTNGCSSPLVPISVFVEPLPVVSTSGITICSGEPVNLLLNASLTADFSWVASPSSPVMGESLSLQTSNQITDVLTNNSITPQPVNYSITPTAIATGCQGPTVPITVTVNPLPVVQFQLATPVLCNDLPIQFTNLSAQNLDFTWDFGNGNNSTNSTPTITYAIFGPQTITLTGVDQQTGCQNSFTQIVQLQESPIVDFSVSDSIGCVVMNTTFSDNMNANGTTTFIDFGDGQSAFVNGTIDHQYLNAGCYDVTMTVSNTAGCVVTAQQQNMVCVYDYPIADFSASQDTVLTTDTEVDFVNQSIGATYYNWSFGDGQTSVATNPTHLFPETAGNYPVVLYVYNEGNCMDTAQLTIMVWEELLAYVPNAFTPDANEFNNVFLPVFTAGFDPSSYHLTIFNRWGEVLFESFDSTVGWDGSYNGKIMKQDTYAWKIEFSPLQNDDQIIKMGHVTLLK